MDVIGKSTVSAPIFIMGKISLIGSALFFVLKWFKDIPLLIESRWMTTTGDILVTAGAVVLVVSIIQLGKSIAVGLPENATELKTHGLYRYTRNPIYVGAFFCCLGSLLIALHPVNLILFAVGLAVHLRIVRNEEVFLAKRFGRRWEDYAAAVPRYFGLRRRRSSV